MDLYDTGSYFSGYVPGKALSSSLIKFAACACAAKHLSRVKSFEGVFTGVWPAQAGRKMCFNDIQAHWRLEGARLYDKAISLLMEALQEQGDTSISDMNLVGFSPNDSNLSMLIVFDQVCKGFTITIDCHLTSSLRRRRSCVCTNSLTLQGPIGHAI